MKIVSRINELVLREKPEKQIKYSEGSGIAKHLTNTPRKKLYEYYICDNCGCEIKVEKKKTGGYDAHFDHKIAVNPSCKYSYSSEWTEQEIKHDLVYKLLNWSGLKIKTVLDY
jgi:hypothetical protein